MKSYFEYFIQSRTFCRIVTSKNVESYFYISVQVTDIRTVNCSTTVQKPKLINIQINAFIKNIFRVRFIESKNLHVPSNFLVNLEMHTNLFPYVRIHPNISIVCVSRNSSEQ